ncbi:WYL domain-containing protein [Turicibacter sanguinis]|uniref:helix-turn-helix transcriptional regulator n=1 Tax=Turicibacter sanguinis TaxID=154288 RepID=UPI00232F387D|nr:WYL domain-containing protein [Turicibacter sanguinis]MDB8542462.1 WYL domain-containing protein [Turicibacter sanguinis]
MKLLLGTRSLAVEELDDMINALFNSLDLEEKKRIQSFIGNERFHFTPLKHDQKLVDRIWDFSSAIDQSKKINIEYKKANNEVDFYTVAPVGLVFCDFYFYAVSYVTNRSIPYPISFRVDRILSYEIQNEQFKIPYSHRFESGDFRNKINMMYQGELIKFTFRFTGHSVEAVLDKFPVSRVVEEGEGYCIIEAMSYEQGLLMWILSQGEWIKILTPNDLVEKMKVKLSKMMDLY